MNDQEPLAEQLPSNGEHAGPTPWAEGSRQLAQGELYWLATTHPDGRPHIRPVLAVWHDGALYFCTSARARKRKNLDDNPHCTMTTASDMAHLVLEGSAARVHDAARLQGVARAYAAKYDWHVTVRDGLFDNADGAPTAGPPPYEVYTLIPAAAYGFSAGEGFSATRWRW
jgi:hypothetical protein